MHTPINAFFGPNLDGLEVASNVLRCYEKIE